METIELKRKSYTIVKTLMSCEIYEVLLVTFNDKKFCIKKFNSLADMKGEIELRKSLKKYGISVPKIYKKDKKIFSFVEEFINDHTVVDDLVNGELGEEYFKAVFNIYKFCRFSNIQINFMPENFVFDGKKMCYISIEMGNKIPERDFEKHGIYYWIYSRECFEHLNNLGYDMKGKKHLTVPEANKKIALITVMNW